MEKPDSKQIVGPAGLVAARNVERLRGEMTYAELSRRLAERGHTLAPLALRRIERGARRIDVDDLINLADALGATPLGILLPYDQDSDESVPYRSADSDGGPTVSELWQWALDGQPLNPGEDGRLIQVRSVPPEVMARPRAALRFSEADYDELDEEAIEAASRSGQSLHILPADSGRYLVMGGRADAPVVGTVDAEGLMRIVHHMPMPEEHSGGLGMGFSQLTEDESQHGDD